MKPRWLIPLGVLLLVAAVAHAQNARGYVTPVGYLVAPAAEAVTAPPAAPYQPRPGDIVLYDDFNKFYKVVFKLANTAAPSHVAMVIARPDGTPALLELTGPWMITARVAVIDIEPRLKNYPGVVLVRRIREPLTPEQSHALTQFAEREKGKGFALGRVVLQATPFCPRRQELFATTHSTRLRWFCSEMVVAACTTAKLFDTKTCCANATYPRDLAFDETINLSALYHPPVYWSDALPSPFSVRAAPR